MHDPWKRLRPTECTAPTTPSLPTPGARKRFPKDVGELVLRHFGLATPPVLSL
ncbi:MAG: hypothetical protein H5T69_18920 [Chloroflexi bacterium]|nr:hypothetical protein [Chloroflexota bacterium]